MLLLMPTHSATTPIRFALLAALSLCVCASLAHAQTKITFEENALPIFRSNCLNCHNPDKKKSGLDLSTFSALMAGGSTGKAITPGDVDGSLLYKLVTHQAEPNMPPKGKLPDKDLETIKNWIASGALENGGSKAVPLKKGNDLNTVAATKGRPAGPPPMPEILPLDPAVQLSRAGAIPALAASPWAPLVAVGGQRDVLLYHIQSRDLVGVLPFPEGTPKVLKFSQSGKLLLAGGGTGAKLGKVALFDITSGNRVVEVGDELDEVLAADVSPDQSMIALGGPAKVVKVFSTGDGSALQKLTKHTDWITAVAYSPDGVLLATGDRSGGLRVWEARSGEEFYVLDGHKAAITHLAFRDDANLLASASEDGTIKLWNMANDGKQLNSWEAHGKQGVLSVSFAHDGTIVSAGRDKVIRLWKPDGSGLRDLATMDDIALDAVLSDDGKLAVAGDYAGNVRVIQTADAKLSGDIDPTPVPVAQRLSKSQETIATLAPTLKTKSDQLAKTQAAEAAAGAELAAAQKKADAAKAVALATLNERDAIAQQVKSAEQESAKLKASQVLVALNAAKTELDAKTNEHAAAVAAVQQSEGSIKTLGEQIAASEKSLVEAPQRMTALEVALAGARAAADAANNASAGKKSELEDRKSLVADSASLQQRLADASAKSPDNKAFTEAAKKAGESLDVLKVELASAETSLTGAAEMAQKAGEAVTASEAALAKEKTDSAAAPAALEALKQRVAATTAALPAQRTSADTAAAAIAPVQAKVADLQKQFEELKSAAGFPTPSPAPPTAAPTTAPATPTPV